MSEYSEFFFNSSGKVAQLECFEISHPNFTKTYRVVKNATNGISVKYEDGVFYEHVYYPMSVESLGMRGDLDQGFKISFGDLGEILPSELDNLADADGFGVKPVLKYRTFKSSDLTQVLFGPLLLRITSMAFSSEGATFEAAAPSLNINKTGEIYKISRFPTLRGFL